MALVGTHPERGLRVAFALEGVDTNTARYRGDAFTKAGSQRFTLQIDVKTGSAIVELTAFEPNPARAGVDHLGDNDSPTSTSGPPDAFLRQLGKQLWRQATQTAADNGGGAWPRKVQRWRGRK
ncbi:MAG: hypothetical protein NVS3B20_24610 [Polyangiales bacterium]